MSSSRSWTKEYYLGTQMPYYYSYEKECSPPPGYHPFYIHYLGRHGGKTLTNPDGVKMIRQVLADACEKKQLTLRGLELFRKVSDILEEEEQNKSCLSSFGTRMLAEISHRMYERYPDVFGRNIVGQATSKKSTKDSLKVVLNEFSSVLPNGKIHIQNSKKIESALQCSETNVEYQEYLRRKQWSERIGMEKYRNLMANNVADRIFRQNFFISGYRTQKELNEFVEELFQLYTNQFDDDGVISLEYFFSDQEKEWYWRRKNRKEFYEMGPGEAAYGYPPCCMNPLLAEFLTVNDHAIKNHKVSVNLWITHAQTMVLFLTLLRLHPGLLPDHLAKSTEMEWNDYEVCPRATNLQCIFYEGGDKVLVQVKLNEKTVQLPIPPEESVFYSWEKVKKYYNRVLEETRIM